MKTIFIIVIRIAAILGSLAAGFALGFPLGQQKGFHTGSEWAIIQVDIAAREAGVSLPFFLEEGRIRVIVRQPPDLHKWARQQASREEPGGVPDPSILQNVRIGSDGPDVWDSDQARLLPASMTLVRRTDP